MSVVTSAPADRLTWSPPEGVAVRGTVLVVPGRGETDTVYTRFGTRLSVDGYRVRTLDPTQPADAAVAELTELAAAEQHPLVLVGSDTGADAALRLAAAAGSAVDAVVAAGVTTGATDPVEIADWDDELDARSACPVHRGRLEGDTGFVRGAYAGAPAETATEVPVVAAPVLLVHGADDRIAPVAGARAVRDALPQARLVVAAAGRHDVLNDVAHRSVAAEIVQFLEALRLDPAAAPVLQDDAR
ncbi:alpha/beta hydrolase [Nakamurella leprariae]|uniref:Alpha/beta hydrolase n=1 Tax=Nakamurella leprariae TaxID=2803911 RepID=A0A938YEE7_9ACTN|nr:alpha/beta hydrolase [Nakamurella leprariae]MBM9468319.1 alpha/beta hydrolase [Nakamurella leprariae]